MNAGAIAALKPDWQVSLEHLAAVVDTRLGLMTDAVNASAATTGALVARVARLEEIVTAAGLDVPAAPAVVA